MAMAVGGAPTMTPFPNPFPKVPRLSPQPAASADGSFRSTHESHATSSDATSLGTSSGAAPASPMDPSFRSDDARKREHAASAGLGGRGGGGEAGCSGDREQESVLDVDSAIGPEADFLDDSGWEHLLQIGPDLAEQADFAEQMFER